jgi:oligopeptide transport system ATP-binding protein
MTTSAAASAAVTAAAATSGATATSEAGPLLSVRDLKVHFPIRRGLFQRQVGSIKAVDGVSFDVAAGSTLGLVGESGCGKSTVARAVLRLIPATSGSVSLAGKDLLSLGASALRAARREMQMIFQDPYASLSPRMTAEEIIAEPLRTHGTVPSGAPTRAEVLRLMETVGLGPEHAARYPHELSGGQRQRVGIARALALRPKLIVADEPVSALDVSIQAQIVNLLASLQSRFGLTYVFIAHDLAVVRHMASEVAVMYLGRIVERAPTESLFSIPFHPYTQALLAAIPTPSPRLMRMRAKKKLAVLGEVPSPANPPPGCHFHTRCAFVMDRCRSEAPALEERGEGRWVACHLAEGAPAAPKEVE